MIYLVPGTWYLVCSYSNYGWPFSGSYQVAHDIRICCGNLSTMQSVVTGQAPRTLERKITSKGKQIKQKIIHTIQLKQIVYLRQKEKGEISVRTYQDTYIYILSGTRLIQSTAVDANKTS